MNTRRRDLPLTIGAVLGALVMLAFLMLSLTDTRPVAFRSGSMAPSIPTGGAALVHQVPASQLRVGDVVTVPSGDSYVTHRIVQLTRSDSAATLQLKGDANSVPDPALYEVESAERVVASVPWLGYLLGGLSGLAGKLLVGVYVLWLLRRLVTGTPAPQSPADQMSRPRETSRRERAARRPVRRMLVAGTVLCVALTGVNIAAAPSASAAWFDAPTVTGTTLNAYTVPAPATFSCGGLGVLSVQFTWAAVPGATSYDLHYGLGGNAVKTVTGTSTTIVTAIAGGSAWVTANVNYGSTTWTSQPSNDRSYTVALVSLCS